MTKITRYTSVEDLKTSKSFIQPQKSDSERESELKEFIVLLKTGSSSPEPSRSDKFLKQSNRGK